MRNVLKLQLSIPNIYNGPYNSFHNATEISFPLKLVRAGGIFVK